MADLVPTALAEPSAPKTVPETFTLTLHLKVRPEAWPWLNKAAGEVNQVWNYSNATRAHAARPFAGAPRYLSDYDLNKLVAGCGECFQRIGVDVAQRVNKELVTRGRQFKRTKLRFRKSGGAKRSLGWVPFKAANLRVKGNRLTFMGKTVRLFQMERFLDHRQMPGAKLGDGNFAQNALGEWFLNVPVTLPTETVLAQRTITPKELVGLDPGLKSIVTTSDGEVFEPNRSYRDLEPKIAQAQRRGHKRQAKRLHAKARNQRTNHVHQISRQLIDTYHCLKPCSDCGARTGPAGRTGLVVRLWTCSACGATHNRDINAAKNIARAAPRCESQPKVALLKQSRKARRLSAGTR